ncbi:GNAT family N-acetyltransferase [Falsibacillus pallidus]|uniref:ClpA/ClpB-like protein n=1 Tax=Falsibacillus pallidus TaxID=493781 RepID=A0A370GUA4_9BACI|nr:Clp protease N-terminal domain-containing protein [Falsibacillus pallidus]RDI45513.1 ClpA/ClpB-like protein [Falsibacillus pallidus]
MGSDRFEMTDRLKRIIENAEKEAVRDKCLIVDPDHLLAAFLMERTGVFGEIFLKGQFHLESIKRGMEHSKKEGFVHPIFKTRVTSSILELFLKATEIRERYGQFHLNEGHVLKALMMSGEVDHLLTKEQKAVLISHGTTARDLIVHLPSIMEKSFEDSFIRVARVEEKERVCAFVREHFSADWAETVWNGMETEVPTVFLAENEKGDYIGFAAFDAYKKKKGYFGPMGVLPESRQGGMGKNLLLSCLKEMSNRNYEYAVIGGAGPIEFYEKTCCAAVIPIFEK